MPEAIVKVAAANGFPAVPIIVADLDRVLATAWVPHRIVAGAAIGVQTLDCVHNSIELRRTSTHAELEPEKVLSAIEWAVTDPMSSGVVIVARRGTSLAGNLKSVATGQPKSD